MSEPESSSKRRPGAGYDIRRRTGHCIVTVLTSIDPPRLRFWDPYCDVIIARKEAAVFLRATRNSYRAVQQAVKDGRTTDTDYTPYVERMSVVTIHDIRRWELERAEH